MVMRVLMLMIVLIIFIVDGILGIVSIAVAIEKSGGIVFKLLVFPRVSLRFLRVIVIIVVYR